MAKRLDNDALVAKLTDAELEGLVALLRVALAEQARRSMPPLLPNPNSPARMYGGDPGDAVCSPGL